MSWVEQGRCQHVIHIVEEGLLGVSACEEKAPYSVHKSRPFYLNTAKLFSRVQKKTCFVLDQSQTEFYEPWKTESFFLPFFSHSTEETETQQKSFMLDAFHSIIVMYVLYTYSDQEVATKKEKINVSNNLVNQKTHNRKWIDESCERKKKSFFFLSTSSSAPLIFFCFACLLAEAFMWPNSLLARSILFPHGENLHYHPTRMRVRQI